MDKITKEIINFANELADIAGDISKGYFRKNNNPQYKEAGSPIVTIADTEAEKAMRERIENAYPTHGIIGEEYGTKQGSSNLTWVLDPIDGTIAFASGKPVFVNLIALMDGDEFVLGIINQPITNERWIGVEGQASTLNGEAIHVSDTTDISKARMGTTHPPEPLLKGAAQDYAEVLAYKKMLDAINNSHVTTFGGDGYNYALLASGYIDIVVEKGLSLHDIAALVPVIKGAGGKVTDWQGRAVNKSTAQNGGEILASNGKLF